MSTEDVRQFFRLIDWFLDLPKVLEQQFATEIDEFQKENKMPFISTLERWAMEKGREEGQQKGSLRMITVSIEKKFGGEGKKLLPMIRDISDPEQLEAILECIWTLDSLESVHERIAKITSDNAV